MNPKFFGDSYDLVKRFFCTELASLGYAVIVDPMSTSDWGGKEPDFYRLIGAVPAPEEPSREGRAALFIDPDTGVRRDAGPKHVAFERLAAETRAYALVFCFDQSFSRSSGADEVMRERLAALAGLGCHGFYYVSHARFLFLAKQLEPLLEFREHLLSLGLPKTRLFDDGTWRAAARRPAKLR